MRIVLDLRWLELVRKLAEFFGRSRSIRRLGRLSDFHDAGSDIRTAFVECSRLQPNRLRVCTVKEAPEIHRLLIGAEERAFTHDGDQNAAIVQQVVCMKHMVNILAACKGRVHYNAVNSTDICLYHAQEITVAHGVRLLGKVLFHAGVQLDTSHISWIVLPDDVHQLTVMIEFQFLALSALRVQLSFTQGNFDAIKHIDQSPFNANPAVMANSSAAHCRARSYNQVGH